MARRTVEISHLLVGRQIEQGVEQRVDAAVAIGWGRGHQCLAKMGGDARKMRSG
jgi:hypothetical protein